MATEAYMRALPGGQMTPASQHDADMLDALRPGETVRVTVKRPRNLKFHRKFFALLQAAYQFEQVSDRYENLDQFLQSVKIAIGHADRHEAQIAGERCVILIPRSISFASMDDTEFERFYSATLDALLRRWLRGVSEDELERQAEIVLGFDG